MPDRSSLPKNQPLPLHPPSDWRAGWGKGWLNSALHLFKGQGGAPELLAWDLCTLEERSSSPRSSTMSCVSAGSDGEQGEGLQEQLFLGVLLHWRCCFMEQDDGEDVGLAGECLHDPPPPAAHLSLCLGACCWGEPGSLLHLLQKGGCSFLSWQRSFFPCRVPLGRNAVRVLARLVPKPGEPAL